MNINFGEILRIILKNKFYLYSNIFGLTVGIAIFVIVFTFYNVEKSVDSVHLKKQQIFRVEDGNWCVMPSAVGPVLKENIPAVLDYVRFNFINAEISLEVNEKNLFLKGFTYADNSIFNIFTLNSVYGDLKNSLNRPNTIVLSKSISSKLFNTEDPIGAKILINGTKIFEVTGVFDDLKNTHLPINVLASYSSLGNDTEYTNSYNSWFLPTYVLLDKNANKSHIEKVINRYIKGETNWDNDRYKFRLRSVEDIYFSNEELIEEHTRHGSKKYIAGLLLFGVFILCLSSINFVNISTAIATERLKGILIKKSIGATRTMLITPMLMEAGLLGLIAGIFSFILLWITDPVVTSIFKISLLPLYLSHFYYIIIFAILFGFVSGVYPALYSANLLNKKSYKSFKGNTLREYLLVFQLAISVILFIGTITIFLQMKNLLRTDGGFSVENIVNITLNKETRASQSVLKRKLLENPIIEEVSFSKELIGKDWNIYSDLYYEETQIPVHVNFVDPSFINLYALRILKGRNFNWESKNDVLTKIIVNESLVKKMDVNEPIGRKLHFPGGRSFEIIGVVKDFNFESKHYKISPMIFVWDPRSLRTASIKIQKGRFTDGLTYIEKVYTGMTKLPSLNYSLFEDFIRKLYEKESILNAGFILFTIISITISGLGILSLIVFYINKRLKEIGIRKVLGATMEHIIWICTKSLLSCIIIANLIAFPLVFLLLKNWLQDFEYRIDIPLWVFPLGFVFSVSLSVFTSLYHIIRAGLINPIKVLKCE